MMRRIIWGFCLAVLLLAAVGACAENGPVTAEEIRDSMAALRELALQERLLNDPAQPEAEAEDGYACQFEFGVLYTEKPRWDENAQVNVIAVGEADAVLFRGINVYWEVNDLMAAIPCENPTMDGNYTQALLYLEEPTENSFRYGLVQRDGQRISAMEYGAAEEGQLWKATFQISGDGIDSIRLSAPTEEDPAALKAALTALGGETGYRRVARSRDGEALTMFSEEDLVFGEINFLSTLPDQLMGNAEVMIMDNEDGTWLERVDGEGFEAVFSLDAPEGNARMQSFTILSPDLEGPRCVRIGDLFHEDYTRFRSGEGDMDAAGLKETLYGTWGTVPYGAAEYGDGQEMLLRYGTGTSAGINVELILRYEDTVLTEIILHTLDEDENDEN